MGKKDKKEKKEKKVKKEKTGPKRAKTAYICFVEERRPKVVKENPKLQAKEILSKLGAEWKAMKEADAVIVVFNPDDPCCEREAACVVVAEILNKQVLVLDPNALRLL